ncbi:MAG: hypothetical protein AAY43_04760 [Methanosarcina sp. 795]|uniref:Uncharacterized protein n=2 Tax=Methanosarcina thermophila TaxID=2210 RepID=A0A0E3L0L3_METTE|nr:hypothetical protein MSTHT_2135 [Methanosarcina thermophila TM-1]AKB15466.1 hypothetical protein MSTHC_1148 [Methanosarcina thermophila CHTI-55]ALK05137.1 MAG: hypothetical protein AAY43_04760 [Methanosarcina sp. 795]
MLRKSGERILWHGYTADFSELNAPERGKFHGGKAGTHDAEYFRDCRPGNGNDLFAKNQNGGLKICWTLQRQV